MLPTRDHYSRQPDEGQGWSRRAVRIHDDRVREVLQQRQPDGARWSTVSCLLNFQIVSLQHFYSFTETHRHAAAQLVVFFAK